MIFLDSYKHASSTPFGGLCWEFNEPNKDYILVPDANDLSFVGSAFSMSAWVKLTNTSKNKTILAKHTSNSTSEYLWLYNSSEQLIFWCSNAGVFTTRIGRFTNALTAYNGIWAFMTVTKAAGASASTIKIYVNAVQSDVGDSNAGTYVDMANTTAPVRIGTTSTGSNFMQGRMADVYIWDKELSGAEVTAIYNGGTPRNENVESLSGNIVSSWNATDTVDGLDGVEDQTGTNDGTLTNMDVATNVIVDYP